MFQMSTGQGSTIKVRVFSDNFCQTEDTTLEVFNDARLCQPMYAFFGEASCTNGQAMLTIYHDNICAGRGREIPLQSESQCTTDLDGDEKSLIYYC